MPVHGTAMPARPSPFRGGGLPNRPVANPIGLTSRFGTAPGSTDSRSEGSPLEITGGFGA